MSATVLETLPGWMYLGKGNAALERQFSHLGRVNTMLTIECFDDAESRQWRFWRALRGQSFQQYRAGW
jgi:hypothetical protein